MTPLPTNRAFQLTAEHEGLYIYMMDYRDIIEGIIEKVVTVEENGATSYVYLTVGGKTYALMQNYSIRLEEKDPDE